MDNLAAILPELKVDGACTADQIDHLETLIGRPVPSDFRRYLEQCGGAEGAIGNTGYISLSSIGEIEESYALYKAEGVFIDLLLFGSDGGGEAYAIDFRGGDVTYVEIPYIGDEVEDASVLGKTIWEMFRELKRQSLE